MLLKVPKCLLLLLLKQLSIVRLMNFLLPVDAMQKWTLLLATPAIPNESGAVLVSALRCINLASIDGFVVEGLQYHLTVPALQGLLNAMTDSSRRHSTN